ncbi:MAG: discoidin domain-containing protein [Phycisphaerales bacterium]|nr:MAG: discoidin domain-containing protein [Phycisphaerales bacterium]
MWKKGFGLIVVMVVLGAGVPMVRADNQLRNWEFDEPLAAENWWLWQAGDFERVEPVPDESMSGDMSLRIVIPDGAGGDLQLIQSYLELVQGETYYISFMARADEPRIITMMLLGRTTHNWAQFWFMGNIELTTEVQTFTYEYTHSGPTVGGTGNFNDDIDIYFNLGDSDVDLNVDRVWIDTSPPPEIEVPVAARKPEPAHMTTDVPVDAVLSWTAGEYAATHDVYLGTSFDDVNAASRANPMDVLVSQGQLATTYESPAPLEFGQTYYWRIDEVNAAPDATIYRGDIWNFTVEPFVYPITNIIATASGSDPGAGPENTINGSGLDASDQHSINATDMWLTTGGADGTWIQYEFDGIYKLNEMWVWNYNVQFELILGFGLKDVTIEYSTDGADWTALGDFELARGTARADYAPNTMIDLGGAAARYVRLTVASGHGMLGQFGLSEVRFYHAPASPRDPIPAAGTADVDLDVTLDWRGGREATSHTVYFSSDEEAVADGSALLDTVDASRYVLSGLDLGTTYYWKIDEVNETASPSTWEGPVWSFATKEYLTVDDFESYTDDLDAGEAIFQTWIDGWENETGSTVGYLDAPFAEQSTVNSGGQSMPLEYDNATAPFYSEAERDFGGQDWTAGGADTLVVHFRGSPAATVDQPGNDPGPLYVAVEDNAGHVAMVVHPDPDATVTTQWQAWTIPFSELGDVNFGSVKVMYIGVGDRDNPTPGGAGIIYIDDIQIGHPAS